MLRILVAAQDGLLRRVLLNILKEWGHQPLVVRTAEEAWQVLNGEEPPSLAILEWTLPDREALALCTRLRDRQEAPYVYVMIIGSKPSKTEMLMALEAGADDFLPQPLEPGYLCLRLRAAEHIISLDDGFRQARQALEYKSTHDALTGTWNRGEVLGILEREIARSRREGWPVAIIMIDVDHFKQVNDTYGHLMGDAALREIATRLLSAMRPYDIVGRFGGEEFLIVLGGCSRRNAALIAERLRQEVAKRPICLGDQEVTVTISLGVAAWDPQEHGDIQALIRAADVALYEAKQAGRNRVCIAWQELPVEAYKKTQSADAA